MPLINSSVTRRNNTSDIFHVFGNDPAIAHTRSQRILLSHMLQFYYNSEKTEKLVVIPAIYGIRA